MLLSVGLFGRYTMVKQRAAQEEFHTPKRCSCAIFIAVLRMGRTGICTADAHMRSPYLFMRKVNGMEAHYASVRARIGFDSEYRHPLDFQIYGHARRNT